MKAWKSVLISVASHALGMLMIFNSFMVFTPSNMGMDWRSSDRGEFALIPTSFSRHRFINGENSMDSRVSSSDLFASTDSWSRQHSPDICGLPICCFGAIYSDRWFVPKVLSQSDGRWQYDSSGTVSSTYAAGIELETLAGVVSLADSELDQSIVLNAAQVSSEEYETMRNLVMPLGHVPQFLMQNGALE